MCIVAGLGAKGGFKKRTGWTDGPGDAFHFGL